MIYCIRGAVFRYVTQPSPSFLGSVDYHLASAMDSQSRTKGTCIFVDLWCNFIYLCQLLVPMIYKGPIELLIADIELELTVLFFPFWSLAIFYLLNTVVPVESYRNQKFCSLCLILFPRLDRRETSYVEF